MKSWKTPCAIEIKMDAEISSYQDDSDDPLQDGPPIVASVAGADEDTSPRRT